VVEALQRIDHLLDIIWQPKAFIVERGMYSVFGTLTPHTYAGRWQVIRYDTATLHPDRLLNGRSYCVICTVTTLAEHNGVPCLQQNGGYMPIGWWLVDFMQAADAANVQAIARLRARLSADEDRIEHAADDDAGDREALDRVHFDAVFAGGVGNWQGKGADFTPTKD
jgi:hypothetical protein